MTSRVLVLLAGIAACVPNQQDWVEPVPQALTTGPYVMALGDDRAIVAFTRTSQDRRAIAVVWSTASGERGVQVARRRGELYSSELAGLPMGERVEYRIEQDGSLLATGQFRTGRKPGEHFRFITFGDTRTSHRIHRAVVEAAARENIDFFLHTGDMVERGGKRDHWTTFFQIERPLMMKAPIIPSIGNHDASNRGYYERFFFLDRMAGGKSYFVRDWGNVRLVSIDTEIACEGRCDQYVWVERVLAEGAAQHKIMVMFLHYPPFSSGAHGSYLNVQVPIKELARRYGVELVIAGHDHNYERTKPIDGTTYIVSGSAGAPIRPIAPQPFSASARTEPHYVVFDVDGDRLSMRAINLYGEVFDHALIALNPPGGPRNPVASGAGSDASGAASVTSGVGAIDGASADRAHAMR